MGQREVLKILKEDEWIRSQEIAKKLKQDSSLVSLSLNKLLNQGLVLKKQYKNNNHKGYEWMLK